MAKGSIMLQLTVFQVLEGQVSEVEPIFGQVFDFLTLGRTTVREVAMQKQGGLIAAPGEGNEFGFGSTGFATLKLLFPTPEREPLFFLAPSHVASPQFDGAGLALLEVKDSGLKADNGNKVGVSREVAAHAYLDEIDIPKE